MSQKDKERWNKKYQNSQIMPNKTIKVLRDYAPLSQGKEALDIACGRGRHAKYLAEHGFRVEALDISRVALRELENIEGITPKEVDLDSYELEENRYDLIVCVNYLDRKLFPKIYKALKNNGLFIFQTFIYHLDNTKAPSNRNFLLEQGELKKTFEKEYEILYLREYWDNVVSGNKLMCGSFVGRKIIKF